MNYAILEENIVISILESVDLDKFPMAKEVDYDVIVGDKLLENGEWEKIPRPEPSPWTEPQYESIDIVNEILGVSNE